MKFSKNKNNFLYLVILAFVFISTSALAISGAVPEVIKNLSILPSVSKNFPPNPVLGASTTFPVISAEGVLAVDLDSGVSLYEKNPDTTLLPASTTKIVTALVSLDAYKPDDVLTVGKGVGVDGQKIGLFAGEQMTAENLLYSLLVYSANDAAETLAQNYPNGGYDGFIAAMNAKAKDLSMNSSGFENPVGLDNPSQITTARDLVRAAEVAMRNPEFAKIVGTKEITVTDVTGKDKYDLKNVNELLGQVPGVLGVKTGWTQNARENLVTYIERDGHRVMIAILGSEDRFGETKELIDWIFSNYQWQGVQLPS
ncbi:MAG: D-alanyl-D-alanine carboxypeptidase family protein [Candidatus Microgenomates bacterium]|jgi:D-alanyl-D-alanine carboxypeptidase (penicillin-binding protein 5/6)